MSRTNHNRLGILRSNTRVLCTAHGLQIVVDFFLNSDGHIMQLECGCRRKEQV